MMDAEWMALPLEGEEELPGGEGPDVQEVGTVKAYQESLTV